MDPNWISFGQLIAILSSDSQESNPSFHMASLHSFPTWENMSAPTSPMNCSPPHTDINPDTSEHSTRDTDAFRQPQGSYCWFFIDEGMLWTAGSHCNQETKSIIINSLTQYVIILSCSLYVNMYVTRCAVMLNWLQQSLFTSCDRITIVKRTQCFTWSE